MTKDEVLTLWREEYSRLWQNDRTRTAYKRALTDLENEAVPIKKRLSAWVLVYQNLFDEEFPLILENETRDLQEQEEAEAKKLMGDIAPGQFDKVLD